MKRNRVRRFVFRADGDSNIGLGHVFRLLSLVELCKNDYECLFVICKPERRLFDHIRSCCPISVISAENEINEMINLLRMDDILVLDGYHFDANYQKEIKPSVHKLIMIDDTAESYFYADLIINHGGIRIEGEYKKEVYSKLLTGFNYLIVRPEFLAAARVFRTISTIESVFICMGGADPFNVTVKAVRASMDTVFIKKINIVTGTAYSYRRELQGLVRQSSPSKTISHTENISAAQMVELMRECQVAICPASSVALEACCVKIGLLTGTVIENQFSLQEQLLSAGCCASLGDLNIISSENIKRHLESILDEKIVNDMINRQQKTIDGLSGERLQNEFYSLANVSL